MTFRRGLRIVAVKEFRHLRHDMYALLLAVIIPVFEFLLFGYALDTKVHDVPTAVQDLDGRRFSRALVDGLSQSKVFRLTRRAASEQELVDLLRTGEVRVALQIPPQYSTNVFYGRQPSVRLWVDGSDTVVAGQTVFAARSIGLEKALVADYLPRIRTDVLFNPGERSANYFVPALIAILVECTAILLIALSMAKERERGTLDQLRITNLSFAAVIGGKVLCGATVALGVGVALVALMQTVFGIPVHGSGALLALAVGIVLLPASGLGLLITSIARNQSHALQLTWVVVLPSILVSGFAFPRESMPPVVQAFSMLLPATWSTQVMRGVVLRGAGLADLGGAFLVMALLGAALLFLGVINLKRRLA